MIPKHYLTISLLVITFYFTASSTSLSQKVSRWENEFNKFRELDEATPLTDNVILFTGSSSLSRWNQSQKDLNNKKILNRSFGGSQIIDLIENFAEIISKYNPEGIVIYSGDNDIAAGKSAEVVYGDFGILLAMIKAQLPETKVFFIAIKPSPARWHLWPEMLKTNTMISNYLAKQEDAWFVDIYSPMLGIDGLPKKDLFVKDGLHMTRKGYDIWTEVLAPYLAK